MIICCWPAGQLANQPTGTSWSAASPQTKNLEFRGSDSTGISMLRGGIPRLGQGASERFGRSPKGNP